MRSSWKNSEITSIMGEEMMLKTIQNRLTQFQWVHVFSPPYSYVPHSTKYVEKKVKKKEKKRKIIRREKKARRTTLGAVRRLNFLKSRGLAIEKWHDCKMKKGNRGAGHFSSLAR